MALEADLWSGEITARTDERLLARPRVGGSAFTLAKGGAAVLTHDQGPTGATGKESCAPRPVQDRDDRPRWLGATSATDDLCERRRGESRYGIGASSGGE